MSRRKTISKRSILPDPIFGSNTLAKFINVLMCNGKKSIAEKIVYGALQKVVEKKYGSNGEDKNIVLGLFEKALDAIRPTVEVRSCRVGGATYQVPVEVRSNRSAALAMRWLVDAANARAEKGMVLRLAGEILDIYDGKWGAIRKREDVHKMARANQAFAHYRW